MALMRYRIEAFYGLNQGASENGLPSGESPDACNMDTEGGALAVARGYAHHSGAPFPAPEQARRLFAFGDSAAPGFLVAAENGLYVLENGAGEWRTLAAFAEAHALPALFDAQKLKIGSAEYLVLSNGLSQSHKWDGESETAEAFGSAALLSDAPVTLLELYFNRLFAAGDALHPSRLYWSCAPGDGRTVEDWSSAPESENVGGGFVEVGADSDPITGLFALSNQLVVFKRDSLYRLLGDRPGNFRITPVNAAMDSCVHTACVRYGDVLYFLTRAGLYLFDGQSVKRMSDADKARAFLKNADVTRCVSAASADKLYFSVREGGSNGNNAVLVYDLSRGVYMVRRGFAAVDFAAVGGRLYLLDGNGFVCRFGEGESYAGEPIDAHWYTPETDLGDKTSVKRLRELYLRGAGKILAVSAETSAGTVFSEKLMPERTADILEVPLSGEGRAFRLRLGNEGGSRFTVEGGVELLLDAQRRVL